jgi:hypothetical protein
MMELCDSCWPTSVIVFLVTLVIIIAVHIFLYFRFKRAAIAKYGPKKYLDTKDILIGVDKDNIVYIKNAINDPWKELKDRMMSVAQIYDGTLLGVGLDNKLYTKPDIFTGEWVPTNSEVKLIMVKHLSDNTLAGVGLDNKLYVKTDISGWILFTGEQPIMISVEQLQNGLFIAVGKENVMYTKGRAITDTWIADPGSTKLLSVSQLSDGKIMAVGLDGYLYTTSEIKSNTPTNWARLHNTCCLRSINSMSVKTTEMDKLMNILRGEKPQQGGCPDPDLDRASDAFCQHPESFQAELPFY